MTKWGDRPHWEFDASYLGSDEHGDWLGIRRGTTMARPGMTYVAPTAQVGLVPPPGPDDERGWLATFHDVDGPLRVYVDVTTPPVWDGAVVRAVDLDQAVERVDIGAILDRVDVDAVVARADLDRAVARVDIQAILDRVDVDAIAQRLDLDAVVARLDLVALAEFVVEGIDLPGIIQSSSGAMASESIREVRWQGVSADERVAHVVDRMLRRRPRTPGPALPGTELPGGPVIPGTTV